LGLKNSKPKGNLTMAELKTGDVVKLKSGGTKMTVTRLEEEGHVKCNWFEHNDTGSKVLRTRSAALVKDVGDSDGS
jgi:uncharacterized protein YodC (DUF2158 family)